MHKEKNIKIEVILTSETVGPVGSFTMEIDGTEYWNQVCEDPYDGVDHDVLSEYVHYILRSLRTDIRIIE